MKISLKVLTQFFAGLALGLVTACAPSGELGADKPDVKTLKTVAVGDVDITVTILGSGAPTPTPDQYGPSVLIQAGGKPFLFDCGRGCTPRLAQVDPKLISSLENLFVTHLHSDHIVGIDDLWMNGWTQGRDAPLVVYGPPGTKRFFTHIKEAFSEDIGIRIKKGLPSSMDGIAMAMTDITEDQVVYEKDGVTVTAFLVDHKPVEPAFGYRLDYAGRSVVISGDTKPSQNLIINSMNADVILHEVMSPNMLNYLKTKFTEAQYNSIIAIHTTAEQAAEIFNETTPRLGVYYHTRNTPTDEISLIEVTAETYNGDVVVGKDLLQITIGDEINTTILERM